MYYDMPVRIQEKQEVSDEVRIEIRDINEYQVKDEVDIQKIDEVYKESNLYLIPKKIG